MKVLFISHETSRSGAPFVLLYFLKWIKEHHPHINLMVLSIHGGELEEEFQDVADTYFSLEGKKLNLFNKFKNRAFGVKAKDKILKKIAANNFDVIYANTIVTIPLATQIAAFRPNAAVVAHIHELHTVIELLLPQIESYSKKVKHFITVSQMSKDNLVKNYHFRQDSITIFPEFTDLKINRNTTTLEKKFVIGGSGNIDWRKGADLFINVAINLKKMLPDFSCTFNWVGNITKEEKLIIDADIEKAGLREAVNFLGEQKQPEDFYKNFDIFLLTSREDPFPLAAIELGMMGIPIICFDKATGIAEVVKNGGGFVIPYLDTVLMAEKVFYYLNNPNVLKADGETASRLFSVYTPENICPEIFKILQEVK